MRDRRDDDHGGDQLEHKGGHIEPQRDGVDQPEHERAQDHPDDAPAACGVAAQEGTPPMSSDASAMVTMPEPMSMLTDFCDCASRQPDRPVKRVGDAQADDGRQRRG